MKLGVTSWSFTKLTLAEVASLATLLGFGAIDLGYRHRPGLERARVLGEPEVYGGELARNLGIQVANIYHLFGENVETRALSDPTSRIQNKADFENVLRFAQAAGASSVFVLPGIVHADQSHGQATRHAIEALKPMVEAGQRAEVIVCVEPHVGSILESPDAAAQICERVPGLRLALDCAHFIYSGHQLAEIISLVPYAGHVHLRQARAGQLQTSVDDGVIEFTQLFSALLAANYQGWMACEYVHQPYMDCTNVDVLSQTVAMRDLVLSWQAEFSRVS